jgi:hypothetical protein
MPIERSGIGIMDFSEDEKEETRYCKRCLDFDVHSPLRNRIYEKNQIEIDHENWLQCYHCGSIYAVNEDIKRELKKGLQVDIIEDSMNY